MPSPSLPHHFLGIKEISKDIKKINFFASMTNLERVDLVRQYFPELPDLRNIP